ncbi:hypothetical protein PR048_015737 [Dryococelus australis]|uniref:Uncharacterized protein n=1 Tax=Dryococelus australis TaxID=614101 RepID=A0ABQ9HI03_9NEOP|nr:hypothetical protein PR048_015737 [Dryococelus australis]
MRASLVSMEQCRNERARETGYPRENPLTNGIVRHDPRMRKSGDPAGDNLPKCCFRLLCGMCRDAGPIASAPAPPATILSPWIPHPRLPMRQTQSLSRRINAGPRPSLRYSGRKRAPMEFHIPLAPLQTDSVVHCFERDIQYWMSGIETSCAESDLRTAVTERLTCSPPSKANRVQSPVGSLPDFQMRESCWTMPLNLPFPAPLRSDAAAHSPQSPSSALKTSLLKAAQISSPTSLTHVLLPNTSATTTSVEQGRRIREGMRRKRPYPLFRKTEIRTAGQGIEPVSSRMRHLARHVCGFFRTEQEFAAALASMMLKSQKSRQAKVIHDKRDITSLCLLPRVCLYRHSHHNKWTTTIPRPMQMVLATMLDVVHACCSSNTIEGYRAVPLESYQVNCGPVTKFVKIAPIVTVRQQAVGLSPAYYKHAVFTSHLYEHGMWETQRTLLLNGGFSQGFPLLYKPPFLLCHRLISLVPTMNRSTKSVNSEIDPAFFCGKVVCANLLIRNLAQHEVTSERQGPSPEHRTANQRTGTPTPRRNRRAISFVYSWTVCGRRRKVSPLTLLSCAPAQHDQQQPADGGRAAAGHADSGANTLVATSGRHAEPCPSFNVVGEGGNECLSVPSHASSPSLPALRGGERVWKRRRTQDPRRGDRTRSLARSSLRRGATLFAMNHPTERLSGVALSEAARATPGVLPSPLKPFASGLYVAFRCMRRRYYPRPSSPNNLFPPPSLPLYLRCGISFQFRPLARRGVSALGTIITVMKKLLRRLRVAQRSGRRMRTRRGDTAQKNVVANESVEAIGRITTLPPEVEQQLVDFILRLEELLFGVTITDVRKLAFQIAERN